MVFWTVEIAIHFRKSPSTLQSSSQQLSSSQSLWIFIRGRACFQCISFVYFSVALSLTQFKKMNKFVIAALVCAAVVLATPIVKRQIPQTYVLPDGAELVLGPIVGGFSCENRIYGYYADVANGCRVYHVCVPVILADGIPLTTQYSFFCGNQTVFDQANLVCSTEDQAAPCQQAEQLYSVNENFGKTDRPLLHF